MRSFGFKLLLLLALFAALVIKGGQLISGQNTLAMAKLVERSFPEPPAAAQPRPIEEEFRGVSPLPSLLEGAPARKEGKDRPVVKRKAVKTQAAQAKESPKPSQARDAAKKPARKG
ncbi:hypothetical protein NNJEOMEG_03551 [Fundidesulfovibrio magnetotacticus]|uniref:Uncharacterized protein n=1 Tax=Fundidesulfovibrio magnetotacticus TaxID=2730080 RepID=A0A6V8LT91_9BACT|nr:hypothetical protein [Fundidesulfovibrio magnetotacticus]GFK95683.1 hypothetical protein NNJEOMEG_03551 [Fundidesulfovibrio magnetotacticus]